MSENGDGGVERSSIGIEVNPEAERIEFEVADKRTATIGDVQYCVAGTETAIETENFEVLEDLVSGDGPRTRIAIEMDYQESELKYHSANSGAAVNREPLTAVDLRKLNTAINLLDPDGEVTLAFDHHGPLVISDHENMVVVAPIVLDGWPEFDELKEQREGSA